MTKRNVLDIYAEILRVIERGGNRKTSIVYKANVNFNRCEKYIGRLAKAGLIRVNKCTRFPVHITDKGSDYLIKHKALRKILPLDGQMQKGVNI